MQLLLVLAILLLGGKSDVGGILKEVKPLLEELGGDDGNIKQVSDMVEAVEEISAVMNAVNGFAAPQQKGEEGGEQAASGQYQSGFPLAPIANIADKNITYALARYMSEA